MSRVKGKTAIRARVIEPGFCYSIRVVSVKSPTRKGEIKMDTSPNFNGDNKNQPESIGDVIREILGESSKRRVVIRNRSGREIIECSLLLALFLSIGAPVIPIFVVLGVLVEIISVSFKKK